MLSARTIIDRLNEIQKEKLDSTRAKLYEPVNCATLYSLQLEFSEGEIRTIVNESFAPS